VRPLHAALVGGGIGRLKAVFIDWETRTARRLEAAKIAGEIDPRADCMRVSFFFWIG
jgi:TetR/AcrR family transcriptional repressor of nem operon